MSVPEKTTVFKEVPGNETYRIPSLLYLDDAQTFLAFAESRLTRNDTDARFLVMSRGRRQHETVEWSLPQEVTSARLPGHRSMNPCPVYERTSRTLFLFFICVKGKTSECKQKFWRKNAARLCVVRSKTHGETWSDVTDLTATVIGSEEKNWATFAVGPGHGVQMECGRLIIPAYVYYIHRRCFGLPVGLQTHALSFYSDDGGEAWHRSDIPRKSAVGMSECEMAEIGDHDGRSYLYCNARSTSGCRVEALSKTRGQEFDSPHQAKKLVETGKGCQGSVVSFPVPQRFMESAGPRRGVTAGRWLLFSHPTDSRNRRNLGVYLNRDPLHSSGWKKPWIISRGPSGYSDLTYCQEGELFGCLLECGAESECEEIAFATFHLKDVIEASGEEKTGGSVSSAP
ncbi:sialidase-3 [Lepisosteus oculatus]|uniref:sialidase-3 n=1 Tax=Lepisosteus oculatus TaxID=7918 RepID=UPI00371C9C2F